jgi:hypothetical protein
LPVVGELVTTACLTGAVAVAVADMFVQLKEKTLVD